MELLINSYGAVLEDSPQVVGTRGKEAVAWGRQLQVLVAYSEGHGYAPMS